MQTKPFYKQIKAIPYIFLSLILVNLIISVFSLINAIGETKILDVNVKKLKTRTYQTVDIGKDSFVTGTEGRLYWKVKNYKEAFLILAADRNGPTNLYDLFYLLVIDIALFIMVYRIREDTVFSNQVFFGLRLIACSVIFYPFITFVSYEFSSKSIEELTKGQFTAQFRSSNIVIFLTIFYLLLMMSPLIKKAIKLQQEKDLTI